LSGWGDARSAENLTRVGVVGRQQLIAFAFANGGDAMSGRDIVVIGASAGGIEPLISLLGALPHRLGAAVFITIHRRADRRGSLAHALRRHSNLPLHTPVDGERGRVRNERSRREYLHRPSIDVLFRSAA
jgi:two-component system chemotaxis response regulator CheB